MRGPQLRHALLAAALTVLAAGQGAHAAATPNPTGNHCVVTLARTGAPLTAKSGAVECFATAAALVVHETAGHVVPDPNDDPLDTLQLLVEYLDSAGPGETVVGIGQDYDYIDETLTFKGEGTTGCTGGNSYYWPAMPSGWNDKLDGLETYSGCVATVWEHENKGGASLGCPCATMGVLEDEVSSANFYKPAAKQEQS